MLQRYLKNRLAELHRARKSDKGFTLTELLIVIVILGVLAGIVVFAVATLTDDSRVVACKTDRRTIQAATAAYRASAGAYPTFAELVAGYDPDGSGPLLPQTFLAEAPNNPDYTFTIDAGTGAVSAVATDADLQADCNGV